MLYEEKISLRTCPFRPIELPAKRHRGNPHISEFKKRICHGHNAIEAHLASMHKAGLMHDSSGTALLHYGTHTSALGVR